MIPWTDATWLIGSRQKNSSHSKIYFLGFLAGGVRQPENT